MSLESIEKSIEKLHVNGTASLRLGWTRPSRSWRKAGSPL